MLNKYFQTVKLYFEYERGNFMTQNKQELARLIKDISNTKKSIEKAQATIKTKSSVFDMQLRDVEEQLGITNDILIEIGRVAVRYFGWTISADKPQKEKADKASEADADVGTAAVSDNMNKSDNISGSSTL